MTLEGPNGGDPTKAVKAELDSAAKRVTRDAMHVWFGASQDRLIEAAEQRAGTSDRPDDSEGREYRRENNLTDMLDEFQPPRWDEEEGAWVFTVTHAAAVFHEFGARPHEIRARRAQALAYEWPDAPEDVKQQFDESFPTVFHDKVQHPGTPAIGMIRYGREHARRRLKSAGYQADAYVGGEDGGG